MEESQLTGLMIKAKGMKVSFETLIRLKTKLIFKCIKIIPKPKKFITLTEKGGKNNYILNSFSYIYSSGFTKLLFDDHIIKHDQNSLVVLEYKPLLINLSSLTV